MGFYTDRIWPRLLNAAMSPKRTGATRARVCAGLAGDVVEIGFGTGHNLAYLPAEVTSLRVVEPSGLGVQLAGARIAASTIPVEVAGLDGQVLPFVDGSADAVLCTWSLCTIPDAVQAVREVRRVLKPGGALHFVEHGRAPDASVRVWQDRLDGLEQRIAGGCHLNRDIVAILEAGGLQITSLDTYYEKGEPRAFASMYLGRAVGN